MLKNLLAALVLLVTSCGNAFADINIGTWNLEHLSVRPTKDMASIAKVAKHVDFLAVQELMNEEGLQALESALEQATGEKWSSLASHSTGRSSYKEMYGFVWRDKAVAYEDGAVTYLDRGDRFEREPFSARFRNLKDKTTFVAATVHILYGKSAADRTKEIAVLGDYWDWLKSVYDGNTNIMLMGDFNMSPDSPAWQSLEVGAKPLITSGASTLSTTDGKFANLYDNIFIAKAGTIQVNKAGVFDYPGFLGISHVEGRKSVSDHAPIFLNATMAGKNSATPGKRVSATPVAPSNTQLASNGSGGSVRGNSASMIYHRPDCPSYAAVSSKNRVDFDSEIAAQNAHYRIAKNCK
ncbi:endonuclease/exonuclease/phosphatase family protein [Pseudomonas sp. CDFA 602]|uniref:endonuclease/exonuclease/phosphatase family protein n=1 Tax=Pseudomonas californiensis TaxID=2829823 RepID=UPI001E3A636A|nr:endonuclease/exonuclease/phosphatase family protein [Pseudomonas californiensis]MCD5993551.1 endonuclease/exonuclease/phosphatase family protein [Pseudomonas californiensis]MCD5999146.1 endonuclease/exonuclease/phosphatase family protein [Pseudomonas californiensis]